MLKTRSCMAMWAERFNGQTKPKTPCCTVCQEPVKDHIGLHGPGKCIVPLLDPLKSFIADLQKRVSDLEQQATEFKREREEAMDRETRLNNHLKEIKREMSTLKGEIEEMKSVKIESGSLEEQDESKKRLRKRKKKTKTTTEMCPEEGKGRHLGKSSIWAEEDTSVEALETGSDEDVGKGPVRNACNFERNVFFFLGSFLSLSNEPYGTHNAQTSRQQERRGKGSKPASPKATARGRQVCLRRKRRRVVETSRQTKTDGKESRVLCWQSFKGHNGHLS